MADFFNNFLSKTAQLDEVILYAVQSIGPVWKGVAWFLSDVIGYYPIVVLIFVIALIVIKKRRVALELVVISLISFALVTALKIYFDAPRPYLIDSSVINYSDEKSGGLPSGHAVMTLVVLGWIILKHPKSKFLIWSSTGLVLFVGLSRIYLGVHYPSQVLAGWLLGLLLLYIFYCIDKRLWPSFKKEIRRSK